MTDTAKTLALADRIRAIALEGLKFAADPYDIARYNALLDLAAREFSTALALDFDTMMTSFRREIGITTPKIGVDAALYNAAGALLILRRADDNTWGLPGGWADVGEHPADTATRETREESGLEAQPRGILSLRTKGPGTTQNILHQLNILVAMKLVSDPARLALSHEHTESRWITSMPDITWHPGHDLHAQDALAFVSNPDTLMLPILP